MRRVKFRDILWAVARKAGLSPESGNFLTNQAIAIGEYINEWVSRLYSAQDWPEWTKIVQGTPDTNHIVPYDFSLFGPQSTRIPIRLGRIWDVYLVDPATVSTPVSTDYTLREEGIHCGFEHGLNVWLKYQTPSPEFTAEKWLSDQTYKIDEPVYSYRTGECYKSRVNNNLGNDPADLGISPPPHLGVETTSQYSTSFGVAGQNKIMQVGLFLPSTPGGPVTIIPDPPAAGSSFRITVMDVTGTILGTAFTVGTGTSTLADAVTDLYNQLVAALGGSGFIITPDTIGLTITIEHNSDFQLINPNSSDYPVYYATTSAAPRMLANQQLQAYVAAVSSTVVIPQVSKVTIGAGQVIPGATYQATFVDSSSQPHVVEYLADNFVSGEQIVTGLSDAIIAAQAGDAFLQALTLSPNASEPSLTIQSLTPVGIDVQIFTLGSPYWELVPFPLALFEPVLVGAGSDVLKEWGLQDKGLAEEQLVSQETAQSSGDFETAPTAPLTEQQKAFSRYRIQS